MPPLCWLQALYLRASARLPMSQGSRSLVSFHGAIGRKCLSEPESRHGSAKARATPNGREPQRVLLEGELDLVANNYP
jgi:hypothetical protein